MKAGSLQTGSGTGHAARAEAAWRFATDYLRVWSGPNNRTLDTSQEFYGPKVLFHGQLMSSRALLGVKRRFVQRWPVRHYHHRPGTITVACEPGGESCLVRSIFDFTAVSPERDRRSDGIGTLDLVVNFAGERPVISVEKSRVLARFRRA
jgi:hypothetical protein